MTRTYTAEQIIAIGGNEWRTATKYRVYLNDWPSLVGFEIEHYKTGNIQSATLNGEPISNSKAAKMSAGKVFWENGQIWTQNIHETIQPLIAPAIAAAVDRLQPPAETTTEPAAVVTKLRAAGATVRDIAERVGVSVSTIYRWVRGICRPNTVNAARLATV